MAYHNPLSAGSDCYDTMQNLLAIASDDSVDWDIQEDARREYFDIVDRLNIVQVEQLGSAYLRDEAWLAADESEEAYIDWLYSQVFR